MVLAIAAGGWVVAIHTGQFPWPLHQYLRDWVMHFAALVAATLLTATMLGYHGARQERRRRALLAIGCAVPLAITLLHELGQWLWPDGQRDNFDSVRDALLNVLGTAVGWWLLRPPGPAAAAQRTGGDG